MQDRADRMEMPTADQRKEINEEMVGILTAISIVSKRLAKRLVQLESTDKNNG